MKRGKIIVTGGFGFIGSHTIADLVSKGFEVISIDSLQRAGAYIPVGLKKITDLDIVNHAVDLSDRKATLEVFEQHRDAMGIIHFAAYKDVNESVNYPVLYYKNNLVSMVNVMEAIERFAIPNLIFSSSCTVYGEPEKIPVTEESQLQPAASPYGHTKQVCETMLHNFTVSINCSTILLRYFNPAGAHPSGEIGEYLYKTGNNLIPVVTQTAIGEREELVINGNDYPTRDGTALRDFIHVMDVAEAHSLAMIYLLEKKNKKRCEIFNLGSGNGITVKEVVETFEKVSGEKLNYRYGPRREGDLMAIYANNEKAKKVLGWNPRYNLEDMLSTAWNWQKKLKSIAG